MIIKSLKLTNFRNHATYSLVCREEVSQILGANGSGKTSVLEAIYLLTRGKSFRATDPDIIRRDSAFYRAELEFASGETTIATYDHHQKTFLVSDQKFRRLPKKHQYPVVLFEPSDLNLITHAPSRRRQYFDRIFGQLDPGYSTSLSRYEKALKQRNELLKADFPTPESLFSWNVLLAKYGSEIHTLRQNFIHEINARLTTIYRSISGNHDTISIRNQSEVVDVNQSEYLQLLEQSFAKDHHLGHTSFGIHRDDYIFELNHQLADGSASRGESRTIILALKFIEADLLYQKTHLRPIVLLDDVFSELDQSRRRSLIKNFKDHQIIITSVDGIDDLD